MPTLACFLVIFAIFLLSYLYYSSNKITTILPSLLINFNRFHDKLAEIIEENNGSVFINTYPFVGRDILLTSNPADVQHIMSTKFSNYPKGSEWTKRFDIFGKGSFNSDFDEWKYHRKIIRLFFGHHKFKRQMGKILQECVTKEIVPTLDLISRHELVVDFQVLLKKFTTYFSISISTGRKPMPVDVNHLEDDPLSKAMDDACKTILFRHFLPVFVWKLMNKLKIGIEKKYRQAWETFDRSFAHYASIYQEEMSKGIENCDVDGDDFYALKLYMTPDHEIGGVEPTSHPYDIVRDNVMSLIFAAGDSTSTALSWFFWLLSKNPNVEAKIREELEQVSPIQACDIKSFFVFTSEELNKLVYLQAALNETLRLYPPVPFEARNPVHPDTTPSGHHVNEKTTILISAYAMGRMKSVWGEDCHEFKPERWIGKDGKIIHEPSHKFYAFNSGPRICPGKDYAYVLLKTFVAIMMQNYHVKVVEGHPVTPDFSAILRQKNGLMVTIKKIA